MIEPTTETDAAVSSMRLAMLASGVPWVTIERVTETARKLRDMANSACVLQACNADVYFGQRKEGN